MSEVMKPESQSVLRIAILGFGGRAEDLAREARQSTYPVQVVCVADPRSDRRQRAEQLFGPHCLLLERGEDFYNQSIEVGGVWVISQERTHAQLAVPALERGLPLIVEKPLATSIRDAYQICEAFDRNQVPVTVPHSIRYRPPYRKAKEIVESGVLGRIMHIHAVEQIPPQHTVWYYRRGPGMYKSNTTFLLAKSSHDIDIINWMMGDVRAKSVVSFGGADYFKPRPEVPDVCSDECPEAKTCPWFMRLTANTTVNVDKDTTAVIRENRNACAWNSGAEQVDHQTVIIQYEDGTTADFTLNCFGEHKRSLQITGSQGTLYATYKDLRVVTYHPWNVETFELEQLSEGGHGGADAALVQDWIDAVVTGRKTASATLHESAEAVAVCVGAELSMTGHKIVEMDELRKQRPGPEVLLTPQA